MFAGRYEICKTDMIEGSDGLIYTTLVYGYCTAEDAYKALPQVAREEGVSADECAVIRLIDPDEAEQFNS